MSTYTCPHCGQHDLSTQRRHNCPKLPSLSIPLGTPRSRDPIAQEYIARLTRELEAARERERHRERQRDAAEAEGQRLRAALLAVRECANLATAKRIVGEALYTTSEGDSRMDTETRQGLAAEERCALAADTEVSDGE